MAATKRCFLPMATSTRECNVYCMAYAGDDKEQKCTVLESIKSLPGLLQLGKTALADHQRTSQKPPTR